MTGTLSIYKEWLATATPEQIALVDSIYAECAKHYEDGGDTVIECMGPREVLLEFKSIADARKYCGLKVEQATNCRWGEDSDPELERQRSFDKWDEAPGVDHDAEDRQAYESEKLNRPRPSDY
jgi:hypothetical protein